MSLLLIVQKICCKFILKFIIYLDIYFDIGYSFCKIGFNYLYQKLYIQEKQLCFLLRSIYQIKFYVDKII